MPRRSVILPDWPRGMREDIAAEYVGLSVGSLRAEVLRQRMAPPVRLTPGRIVYLREHLDAYLDQAAGGPPTSTLDGEEWMRA